MKLVDLNYHCHTDIQDPEQVIALHAPSSGYMGPVKQYVELVMLKHMAQEGLVKKDDINYHFFTSKNRFWYIPFRTHRFLKKIKPDVILVQGFVFPLQLIALRRVLGKHTVILVQHHGEKPFTGIKGWFQRVADKSIDGYLFTAKGNAQPWQEAKVISNEKKCFELLSASSPFTDQYRRSGDNTIKLQGDPVFIWVGRLNNNKDPLTVLQAFLHFLEQSPAAQLYMIYQTEELLSELKQLMDRYPQWRSSIHFEGKKERAELEQWFNATDYYISGSHSEGSGYALAEAMVCGSIPVVTAIPSFLKIADNGKLGFFFEPGNVESCLAALIRTSHIDKAPVSRSVAAYAKHNLGYQAIADQLLKIASQLVNRTTS